MALGINCCDCYDNHGSFNHAVGILSFLRFAKGLALVRKVGRDTVREHDQPDTDGLRRYRFTDDQCHDGRFDYLDQPEQKSRLKSGAACSLAFCADNTADQLLMAVKVDDCHPGKFPGQCTGRLANARKTRRTTPDSIKVC